MRINVVRSISIISFFVILFISIHNYYSHKLHLYGWINKGFATKALSIIGNRRRVTISSAGGEVVLALAIANKMALNKTSLVISGNCISACAEYFLAGAKSVRFKRMPLVGVHGNPLLTREMVRSATGGLVADCMSEYTPQIKSLYQRSSLNVSFWQYEKKYLKPKLLFGLDENRDYDDNVPCWTRYLGPSRDLWFQREMWFPNSQQLRDLMGLKFKGGVCADDEKKCKKRLRRIYAREAHPTRHVVMIGFHEYVFDPG